MSNSFEPAQEPSKPFADEAPRRKTLSPWLLGCGVLAMALSALGVLALLVAGLLMFAVRAPVRSLPMRAATAIAQQQLPDGSLVLLQQVTYGRQHQFVAELADPPRSTRLGMPPPEQGHQAQTQRDAIVVWFTHWDPATGKPRDFAGLVRAAAVDAHGREADSFQKGRFASGGTGSRSEHGDTSPFSPLPGGTYDRIVAYLALPPFRHNGATFKLRLYDAQNQKIAELDVPNPHSGSTYPEWTPEPLPVAKNDGDVSVTLTALTARSSESTHTVNGIELRETRVQVNPIFATQQAGQPTSDWSVHALRLFDALGNESSMWNCQLSPHESAWKLELRIWRHDKAPFDPAEIWSLAKLPLPAPQQAEYVNQAHTLDGVTVTLFAVGGTGKLSYPGMPSARQGSYSNSSSSYFGQGTQRRRFSHRISVDKAGMTVESELPYVLVTAGGLASDQRVALSDQRIALRLKDEGGQEIPLDGPHSYPSSLYLWFLNPPENAKTLSAELIVHRCRTFEFLVAPPQVQPAQPIVPSRSPRSAEQRLADARRAIDSGQRAQAANPGNADALNNLAWAYATAPQELRDAKQAVALAQRAVQLAPGNSNCLNTLAVAYLRDGQPGEALATLERNTDERPDTLVVFDLYPMAMAQFQLGRKDEAKQTYQRALDLHRRVDASVPPNHWHELYEFRLETAELLLGAPPQQVFDRAGQLAREGKWEPAAAEFAKALEVYPVDHWQWYRSGALQAYRDQTELYRTTCARMLDLFGDTSDPFIAERVGKLFLLRPDASPPDPRAIQLCDKSASLRPDVPWFQLAAAIARYREGKFQEALARLQVAEAQVGNQIYCRVLVELFRAMSLQRSGQQAAAQQALAAAIGRWSEIAPNAEGSEAEPVDYGASWHDVLMCELVRRETEQLVPSETAP